MNTVSGRITFKMDWIVLIGIVILSIFATAKYLKKHLLVKRKLAQRVSTKSELKVGKTNE